MILAMFAFLSASAAPPPVATPPARPDAGDKEVVCIVEAPVGSHLPHRYCATRFYWEERERQDREGMTHWGRGGGDGRGGGGMGAGGQGGSRR